MVARQTYAIILCAGIGSRLSALTNLAPKALIKVNAKAILDFAIAGYLDAGLVQKKYHCRYGLQRRNDSRLFSAELSTDSHDKK
ncbi:hypothetical protein [Helicobacter sp. T3_23-1059]